MKTIDQILDDSHEGRNYNYDDIRKSMARAIRLSRRDLFPFIFKGQQWLIWETLMSTEYTTTGKIAELTGLKSKNVSSQLSQMQKTGLVEYTIKDGIKIKSWIKID